MPGTPTTPTPAEEAGQAVYSRRVLRAYDVLVLGLSNRWIWKCPTKHLRAHYDACVSSTHLDVGVGTGYFLDRCRFPAPDPRIVLLDLNAECLAQAAARIARYEPRTVQASILQPLPQGLGTHRSIGLNYLLHCLPGPMDEKAVAFDHLRSVLAPGGVLFGSTILSGGVPRSGTARRLMALYNRKRIFSNEADTLESLSQNLHSRFEEVEIRTRGCVALFRAVLARPRGTDSSAPP